MLVEDSVLEMLPEYVGLHGGKCSLVWAFSVDTMSTRSSSLVPAHVQVQLVGVPRDGHQSSSDIMCLTYFCKVDIAEVQLLFNP